MGPFDKEHQLFLKALNEFSVKYLIIGGHVSIYYGVNRNTSDLDVLIEPTPENGKKLLFALRNLKLDVPEIRDEKWTSQLVLSFGFEPDAIDILNYSPRLEFSEVYKNYIMINHDGIKFISLISVTYY